MARTASPRRRTTKHRASGIRPTTARLDPLHDKGADLAADLDPKTATRLRSMSKDEVAIGTPPQASERLASVDEDGRPAGIEYVGLPGISKECQDAVLRLLQYGDRITHVRILSSSSDHCLLLTVNVGDVVAVKSGFASGYLGEGSRTFSYVLEVLEAHGAEIEEYRVAPEVLERVDRSSLTCADLERIDSARPVRPRRWDDYVFDNHRDWKENGTLWREFPFVVPFAIIDRRLIDLAISFWEAPDERLLTGYRRLEDIVRARTAINEHGSKLFSQAFGPNGGKLMWQDIDAGERNGRFQLFTGAFMAYRNPRAHREPQGDAESLLAELLLLNHLYRLEAQSTDAKASG